MKLLLFDVDGTLTEPMKVITEDMINILSKFHDIDLGIVGGSNYEKIKFQLGDSIKLFKWHFSENGLLSYCDGKLINKVSIVDYLGEDNYQKLINVCLRVMAEIKLPIKRGNFIELRNGMINITPIGRSCSYEERVAFNNYDKEHKIREHMIEQIKKEINMDNIQFAIGGQISIDIFPCGWDKSYCLKFLEDYDEIYFFGDKTCEGGNDYEIFNNDRVKGFSVLNYKHTMELLNLMTFTS